MLAEYAVEPELLSNWRDYRFYIGQFGINQGRLISRFPKRWKKLVIEAAQATSELDFLRITESLKNIDSMILPRIHEWDGQQDWLPNALLEHSKRPFQGIVARTKPSGSDCVLGGDDIDPAAPDPPRIWAARTADDMAACVAMLLRNCKQVFFVDPHFDPANRRHNLPLRAFLAVIGSRDAQIRLPTMIEYHTSDKNKDVATFSANLDRWIKSALPAKSRLAIVRWKIEDLHNRYILTDRGGVMFGTGLDQDDSDPPSEDTVTLLDEVICAELMVAYSSASTQFTWLDDVLSVTGT